MIAQPIRPEKVALPLFRDPDEEYWSITFNGYPVKLAWGMMTRHQKELQIEAEKRAVYVQEFGIYS